MPSERRTSAGIAGSDPICPARRNKRQCRHAAHRIGVDRMKRVSTECRALVRDIREARVEIDFHPSVKNDVTQRFWKVMRRPAATHADRRAKLALLNTAQVWCSFQGDIANAAIYALESAINSVARGKVPTLSVRT
ncbi:hypothetical protein ABVK25_008769 [Lepraria finkii]|uniref:Uncharacterized protein n=1 Tax=Lepraria finkii TaxID=1340010 RepID=A0ABR4B5F8_9LECA